MKNRIIGYQRDLLKDGEVPIWSSGKPPAERKLRARSSDPKESADTLASLDKAKASVQDRIFDALLKGGLTSHEIAERTGLSLVTVSPMIKPMRQAGILVNTGERRGRRSVWGIAK